MLKLGKVDGPTLSRVASAPKSVVYRTLDELKKKGLIEKEISHPYKFKATPLKEALQIIVDQSLDSYKEKREKTEQFLLRKHYLETGSLKEQEFRLTAFEGKERIIQIIKHQHDAACKSINILSTIHRWLQIIDGCFESYEKALARGVKFKIVLSMREGKIVFPEEVQDLLSNPNFELKVAKRTLSNNLAVIDRREVTFNLYPSKPLKKSPLIWTNHPSFITMAQDHFDKVWKSARKITRKAN